MKNLKQYIQEKLVVNKNYDPYKYHPKTWNELRQIIEQRFEELGPGTKHEPVDFNDIDISRIGSFYNDNSKYKGIFAYTQFKYIDVSNWDVNNIKNMSHLFCYCWEIKELNLSNWDVSNVEDMSNMFSKCQMLKSVGDLSKWNVSNIENIYGMFYDCRNLKSIGDLSNWDVSKVENMNGMFNGCKKLKSIGDLSKWDVSNIKYMWQAFNNSKIKKPNWYKE